MEQYLDYVPAGFPRVSVMTLDFLRAARPVQLVPVRQGPGGGKSNFRAAHDTVRSVWVVVHTIACLRPGSVALAVAVALAVLGPPRLKRRA